MSIWPLPEITPSVLSLFLIVVLIEEVKLFKEDVAVSIAFNLVFVDDVYEFNDAVVDSIIPNLVLVEDVY